MNIEISTKEYRDLLDILHMADVIISGHRRDEVIPTERYRTLIQKIYSLAQTDGLEELIDRNEIVNQYVPTAEFEKTTAAHPVINDFTDHLFWDQLVARLSLRDAVQIAGGIGHFNALNDSDRQNIEAPIRERYRQEFAANGVSNLTVIERFSLGEGMPVETSD